MIKTQEINYSAFGKCLHMTNDKIELVVTLDFGPRIIRASFVGSENFLFEDIERTCSADTGDGVFYNYGGHRMWISPEEFPDTYYPDNEKVEYAVNGNTVRFTPPPQKTGFALSLEVSLSEKENKVELCHYLTNNCESPRMVAPWSITMMANGGYQVIPTNSNDTGYLPNRYIVLWPYAKMNDPRINWGDKYIVLNQAQPVSGAFKFGLSQLNPWAVYVRGNEIFMKRYTYYPDEQYPDGNCSYETYSCEKFIEMETVGVLKTMAVGETVSHKEVWCLFDNVDDIEELDFGI